MPLFLSSDWIAELKNAAATVTSAGKPVRIQQIVRDAPEGTVAYCLSFDEHSLTVREGNDNQADVAISQDYETALALHEGTLSIRDAFFDGRIKVKGNLNALLDNADRLALANGLLAKS